MLPIVGFGVLTLLLFGTVLFRWDTRILGNQTTDLYAQFFAWRDFGFRQLRAGNLALWNPHIYAGAPYFGGFQGALLYPLNVLFLVRACRVTEVGDIGQRFQPKEHQVLVLG
jgi:hypothetical protein